MKTSAKPTYNESLAEIEEIIAKIDNEELDIDKLEENVKRVLELIKFCKKKLKSTEDAINKELNDI